MSERLVQVVQDGARSGIVMSGTGGVWQVRTDDGTHYDVSLRGRLKQAKATFLKLAVGDYVTIEPDERGEAWSITEIAPRRSQLARREPGGRYGERVLVANLDQVLIVFAAANPEPHLRMLDRFLVLAEANELAARIVINKVELVDAEHIQARFAMYHAIGYPLHYTSALRDIGVSALHDALVGKTTALSGPSGVGKSSLLNTMYPDLRLRVGEISVSVNKGRHTTVGAELHALPDGGFVADTPGLREVGLWRLPVQALDSCFPEFRPYLGECRFNDCSHRHEPGCAVREAVASGDIFAERYESYCKLHDEVTESADEFA